MNDTNEKSKKRHSHRRRKSFNDFAREVTVLVVISLVAMIVCVFAANKTACDFVHKLESQMPMQVRDLIVEENGEYANISKDELQYGTLIANISIESRGVNAPVYFGLNRVSLRYGVGVSGKDNQKPFISGKKDIVGGYDETYFKSLKYVKIGDKVTVTSKDKVISYEVVDCFEAEKGDEKVNDYDCDLVLYSIFSNYSENGGKCFYALLNKTNEEVNANEQ
jgi:sortase (surface protein transpeptidase)